jgi:hypothetical protein
MKRFSLIITSLFVAGMIQAQVETVSIHDATPTITPEQIKAMGETSQQNANRDVIVLDFEGLGDLASIGNFYNGGGGTNYGIYFGGTTLAIIDVDAGGTGNIANEPTPSTVMFFLSGSAATMNVPAGFTTGFSFFYSSAQEITIYVYDGVDGTGNLIATQSFPANYNINCTGDPNGGFCHWDPVGVGFAGSAMSVLFTGAPDYCAFDDVTFGSIDPGDPPTDVPVSNWALVIGIGLILIFAVIRFRRIL